MTSNGSKNISTSPAYRIVSVSVMTAVTAVFTFLIKIPITPTRGYINLGDVAIFFTAFTFGPIIALISGGLGTAIADLLSVYAQWAPISLVIHGLQGLAAGLIVRKHLIQFRKNAANAANAAEFDEYREKSGRKMVVSLIAGLVGTIIMVGLYFLSGAALYGIGPAAFEIPGNIIQCAVGFIGGYMLTRAVVRAYPPVSDLFL
jgi:uncharacterized membrane protein